MTLLFTAVGYTLQVIDAVVFAHLRNFDVSKDISTNEVLYQVKLKQFGKKGWISESKVKSDPLINEFHRSNGLVCEYCDEKVYSKEGKRHHKRYKCVVLQGTVLK